MAKMSKLEKLAIELESLERKGLESLIAHVRNDSYRRDMLIQELISLKLRFFANRLAYGEYEQADVLVKKSKLEMINELKKSKKVKGKINDNITIQPTTTEN